MLVFASVLRRAPSFALAVFVSACSPHGTPWGGPSDEPTEDAAIDAALAAPDASGADSGADSSVDAPDAGGCVPIDPGPPTDPSPVTVGGSLGACPDDTTLDGGWCAPDLEVGPLVTIEVPTYEPCASPPSIDAGRSILVTDHERFAAVEADVSLGKLLTDRNAFVNAYVVNNDLNDGLIVGGHVHTRRSGTFQPFEGGREQVDEHNADVTELHLGTVFEIRNSWNEWILGPNAFGGQGLWDDSGGAKELSDPDGPFRLLAVVNRMDLAGETDGRGLGPMGSHLAEDQRKWFGEGRLVFGLTDGGDGARPMTFIVEYRLPALREVARDADSTTYAVQPACSVQIPSGCFDHVSGPPTNAEWIEGRARWARVWRELSGAYSMAEYQARLRDIVRLFARPENFIALRSGENVRDAPGGADQSGIDEFEYREFYSNGGFGLARRHNRREALFCVGGSQLLRDVVVEEYDAAMTTPRYDYKLGSQTFEPRDSGQREVDLVDACAGVPFGAPDGSGGMSMRSAFSRFQPSQLWPAFPTWNTLRGADDDAATNEAYRHTMAFNTCSGCHSAETGTSGFHVAPRAAGADSVVSPFLDGTDHTVQVVVSGQTYEYTYNELGRRIAVLTAFYDRRDLGNETPRQTFQRGLEQSLLTCTTAPCGTDP